MPNAAKLVLVLLALATSGCESCEGCNENESWLESARRSEAPTLEGEAWAGDASDGGPVEAPGDDQPTVKKAVDELGKSLNKLAGAIDAGIAAEKGDSPCERSLTGLYGMYDYLEANAEPGAKIPQAPSAIVFVQVCDGLPIEAQRCMVLSYGKEHVEECQRIYDELPEETKERVRKLTEFE